MLSVCSAKKEKRVTYATRFYSCFGHEAYVEKTGGFLKGTYLDGLSWLKGILMVEKGTVKNTDSHSVH